MNSTEVSTAEVRTSTGELRGVSDGTIRVFKGVPYAQPPVGELRFAAPRPPRPWSGVREATGFAARPPQTDMRPKGKVIGSEDCLYLNVYAPAGPGPYPVMVWLHGGGGVVGGPHDYDCTAFARSGVVSVTVGYRLGALGLMYLPGVFEESAHTNFAFLDQIEALRWVRENISAFGGDPGRVGVMGESNGARAVGTLLAMPAAQGLFGQAVLQSGGYVLNEPDRAWEFTDALLTELGLDRTKAYELRTTPVEELVRAQGRVVATAGVMAPLRAVVDGDTVPQQPLAALASGSAAGVRVLAGSNHDEQELFDAMPERLVRVVGSGLIGVAPAELKRLRDGYRQLYPAADAAELEQMLITAGNWRLPAIRLAEAQAAAGGEVWSYRLDWRVAPKGQGLGAPHGLDLGFVFDRAADPTAPLSYFSGVSRADPQRIRAITAAMHTSWARFLHGSPPETPALPPWPRYEAARRATMLFDDTCTVAEDPDRAERLLWEASV
ncbi:carboxylesterase family protein [Streptomyces sp. NPDC050610]|uniref:carboxylesterase/lipase family protein n=1 Tax=Streptomyces sp. NPDC050610 TaxID=3157097 RepID=UPI003416E5EE